MPAEVPQDIEVRGSSKEDLLDLIFTLDPLTNMPTGTIEQYLSDKTSDEVRSFIERNLLQEHDSGEYQNIPSTLRDDLINLDSDFIAKVSRNRFETKEQYEERVSSYFKEIEQDKKLQKELSKLRAKYAKKDTDN